MKLVIKEGESVENAIKYLQNFLLPLSENYPLLKSNMNVYLTLEGFGHKLCPDNDEELVLLGDGVEDLVEMKTQSSKSFTLSAWENYVTNLHYQVSSSRRCVNNAAERLASAEKRGLKPATIERYKAALEWENDFLKEHLRILQIAERLNELVLAGKFQWYFTKGPTTANPNGNTIRAYIIFDRGTSSCCYFSSYSAKRGKPTGSLRSGTPTGYNSAK